MRGTPSPHIHTYIHTYIHTRNQAGPWFTQLQILDQPVLELNHLNFHLFFDFPPAERVLSTRSSKSLEIYTIKKGYESVNFLLRRARPEIRRPWTYSRPRTYMPHTDPQIHLLWPKYHRTSYWGLIQQSRGHWRIIFTTWRRRCACAL